MLKILFVNPEVRIESKPWHFPFWAGILASIAEKKGAQVGIYDLNAEKMEYDQDYVPLKTIKDEISSEKWDIVCVGGLTTTYSRMKQLVPLIRKCLPDTIIFAGGGWVTYNPDEIFQLLPQLDLVCIGEGEETFSEVYDKLDKGTRDFDDVKGLCINKKDKFEFTMPRSLISDLDSIPYPAYHLFEVETYFRYSSFPYSVESYNAKRRASTVWERGCPRGCTFCSHNGMSRIDMQNILGKGDRRAGEKLVRIADEEENTFSAPARWPTPRYAVDNVKFLVENYQIDFATILDENMTSNRKWTEEFCDLYINEGLNETVKWGTLGDAPSVAVHPSIVKTMKDAGCAYISFGFESASNKVLNEDIKKGQTRDHLQKTLDAIKSVGMTPITTFMIGNPHEDINDIMETLDFWIQNGTEVDPFICTPYVGSGLLYQYKDFVVNQYDDRLNQIENNPEISPEIIKKWKLGAMDKFMAECGDATQYTATVSQYFTIPDLIVIKRFMYTHDTIRLLKMAHKRYEESGLSQWNHDEKWNKYCEVCQAKEEVLQKIKIKN